MRTDLVFVAGTFCDAGKEYLPYATLAAQPHRVAPSIPGVEIAHDADTLRVRRPYGECRALDAVEFAYMGAQSFEGAQVRAFGKQPHIHLSKDGGKPIGIVGFLRPARPLDAQAVGEVLAVPENRCLKEAR